MSIGVQIYTFLERGSHIVAWSVFKEPFCLCFFVKDRPRWHFSDVSCHSVDGSWRFTYNCMPTDS